MPYRDREDRKRYDRERRRRIRAGEASGSVLALPTPQRLRLAEDVEALLLEAATLVRKDARSRGTDKARALGYLASMALRLIEARELQERVEALEHAVRQRRPA